MAEKVQMKVPRRGHVLNVAVATLAALSLAFFIFAMPAEIFRTVAGAVGIGSRAVAMAGAAAPTFALIFFFLRALDRLPRKARRAATEVPAEPPRLRRADAHPDAPARVPVFARHELGDPLPIEQPEPEEFEPAAAEPVEALNDEAVDDDVLELDQPLEASETEPVELEPAIEVPEQPLPSFASHDFPEEHAVGPAEELPVEAEKPFAIDEQPAALAEAVDDQVQVEAVSIEPGSVDDEQPTVRAIDAAPEEATIEVEEQPTVGAIDAAPEEATIEVEEHLAPIEEEPAPFAEAVHDEPALDDTPAFAEPESVQEDQPAPAAIEAPPEAEAIEPMPVVEAEPLIEYKPAPAPAPIVEPIEQLAARLPEATQPREETISDLMGRLETGLGRRDRARWLGLSENDAPEIPADDRLKSAIGMLRRMAGRG